MKLRIADKHIPIAATCAVCLVLYGVASVIYRGFFSANVLVNFLTDNSFLGITAIGMTFVILSGGIDLSVGAVVGFSSILIATLVQKAHLHPAVAITIALALGTLLGLGMGALIRFYSMPPFLVTLAGMFLARGMGFVVGLESIPIDHSFYQALTQVRLPLGPAVDLPATALIFLAMFGIAVFVAHCTRFGRNVYALGGNEQSAVLMGLPIGGTKLRVYALSGFCSALAGVVYTLYTFSGNPIAGTGLELDAIAAVVIGGTLLSGGIGYVAGTLAGVLIFGIIQTWITFEGTLSSWWTKIAIGALLLFFILLQKLVQGKRPG